MLFGAQIDWYSLAQTFAAVCGLAFVALQIQHSSRLSKINLIFQLNERLAGYAADIEVLGKLDSPEAYEALSATQRTRILDYVTVFENMESMRRLRALSPDDIDDFFGGRISELLDNPGTQKAIFFNREVGKMFAPIFSLHAFWITSLKRRGKERPETPTPFEDGDKEFYSLMLSKARAK